MSRKASVKTEPRERAQILAEMQAAEATIDRMRRFLDTTMSEIRSSRFTPYIVDDEGKRKRNPAFKDLREYESTLRAASRHLAALRAEEAALIGNTTGPASEWDEFVPVQKVNAE
jgi:hypothetical protein